jgi:hypothetical protein
LTTINNILQQFDDDFDLDSLGGATSNRSAAGISDAGSIKPDENNKQFLQLM